MGPKTDERDILKVARPTYVARRGHLMLNLDFVIAAFYYGADTLALRGSSPLDAFAVYGVTVRETESV